MSDTTAIPDHFICPISLEIMEDPVICADGMTYERKEIRRWFLHHTTSPKTNQQLSNLTLIPNYAIKSGIDKYLNGTGAKCKPKKVH